MSTSTIPAYEPAVATRNLSKTYGTGEAIVHALNNVNIDFEYGKFTAIMGPSGSGKSTLMQTLATLDTPDRNPETIIRIGDTDLYGQKDNQLTEFRREHVGFIFQAFNLVPTLTLCRSSLLSAITLSLRLAESALSGFAVYSITPAAEPTLTASTFFVPLILSATS